jgi:hypothetical protein
MSLPQTDYFDANLPGASQTVRIASLYDAKVFVCRWVIRDRDPALKALLRDMEKAKNFAMTESVIQHTRALAQHRALRFLETALLVLSEIASVVAVATLKFIKRFSA